jgi:uncharacterized membrane protein YdjX (TVP38/TMEM64 family)
MLEFIDSLQHIELWFEFVERFYDLGPLAPISLAMVESLIPALPLLLIVTFNTNVYGFMFGFLYSYVGVVLGSYIVFVFFRTVVKGYFLQRYYHGERFGKLLSKIEGQDPLFLFLISAIPFTPSSVINILFGLSGYRKRQYFLSIALGKAISVAIMAFFGHSISNLMEKPITMVISTFLIILAYFISQYYSKHWHA